MSNQMPEKVYQKYAWVVLLAVSTLSLLIGLGDFILAGDGDPALVETMTGTSWTETEVSSPRVANLVNLLSRILGAWLIGFSILGIGISAMAYRKGEKWAWYILWALPLTYALIFTAFFIADRVPGSPTPPALFSAPGLFVLSTLALLLPIQKFFHNWSVSK